MGKFINRNKHSHTHRVKVACIMRVVGYLFVLIFFFIGTVVASAAPDSISVLSSEPSLIAIGGPSSTITAHVFNQSDSGELYQGNVRFSLETPSMGTLSQLNVTTDTSGYASTIFTASTIRGNAIIRAEVTSNPTLYNTTVLPVYGPKPDDTSTIITSSEWVVANGVDQSIITVYARNRTYPISNIRVNFSVNDTSLGTLTPSYVTTDSQGKATTTFTAKKKSGCADITASIDYIMWDSPATAVFNVLQKIDHDTPYRIANYTVISDVGVGNTTEIKALIVDRWNNPIDNKRYPENFSFLVSSPTPLSRYSPPNDVPAYWTSTPFSNLTTVQTDTDGNVSAELTVDTRPGMNVVLLHPIGIPVQDKYFFIDGVANSQPWYLEQAFEPPELWVFADGEKLFNITYTLKDRYRNGLSDRNISWYTSLNETAIIATNISGMARRSYGPKTAIGRIIVSAQAEDNLSLTVHETVEFTNMTPVSMRLTASPQSMPSRDVSLAGAQIIAKVMDIKGNPVDGETVTFTIIPPPSYPICQITPPSFSQAATLNQVTAITDNNGNAIVQFWPGVFELNESLDLPLFDPQATSTCNIVATWESISDSVDLSWKNYPYLSVYTSVTPKVVNVTDTVDVNIKLVGDGYALRPKPIDVMLTTDRSGSMLYDNPDRMYSIREAAKLFVDQMSVTRDRIGVVTFGRNGYIQRPGYNSGISTSEINNVYHYPRTYSGYATVDKRIISSFQDVKDELDDIVPDHGTPMRESLRLSIQNLTEEARPYALKAIVLLSDGDYNWYGDPLARGTGSTGYSPDSSHYSDLTTSYYQFTGLNSSDQNMSNYARDYGIKIYSIAFANSMSEGGKTTLRRLAESTGGKYYTASATNIADVYAAIAGDLKKEAGVNTMMNVSYENVEVNSTPMPGNEVFEYVPIGPLRSTKVDSKWLNGSRVGFPGYPYNFSQLNNWTSENNYILHFNVGTIHLNQTWEASYTLRVLKDGNIDLFSSPSSITFDNGTNTLKLPKTFISAIPNMKNESIQNITLNEENVTHDITNSTNYVDQWNWTRTYTGNRDVTEKYFISLDGGQQWVQVDERIMAAAVASTEALGTFRIDLRTVPGGEEAVNNGREIKFRLEAYASDAGEPEIRFSQANSIASTTRSHIKLE